MAEPPPPCLGLLWNLLVPCGPGAASVSMCPSVARWKLHIASNVDDRDSSMAQVPLLVPSSRDTCGPSRQVAARMEVEGGFLCARPFQHWWLLTCAQPPPGRWPGVARSLHNVPFCRALPVTSGPHSSRPSGLSQEQSVDEARSSLAQRQEGALVCACGSESPKPSARCRWSPLWSQPAKRALARSTLL